MRKRFKKVAGFDVDELVGLVIDEVSFIQPEILGRISRLLQAIRGACAADTCVLGMTAKLPARVYVEVHVYVCVCGWVGGCVWVGVRACVGERVREGEREREREGERERERERE
eukprot:COSAG01_NODE_39512_length_475_cov_2.117021_1_plen_113_part_01